MGIALLAIGLGGACGSSGHPDTGAGANQPVPPAENCADLCGRLSDCVVTLCNEDTMSTKYTGLQSAVDANCVSMCNDSTVQSMIPSTAWSCIFTSSCRAVFEHDVCHSMSHYFCN